MRLAFRSLAVVLPALFLASCENMDWGDSQRYKEDFHYTYNVKPGGRLTLETFNGAVEIAGTGGQTVEIHGTKFANTQQAVNDIKIDIQQNGDSIAVKTIRPYGTGGMGARYSIRVPRQYILERIATSNSSIRVEDVEGPAYLRSTNGSLRVYRLKGNVDATTSNSSIELSDVTGNALLKSSNGSIRAELTGGSFEAATSNASITARLSRPAEQPVRAESSNGSIDLTLDAVRDVKAQTSNSSITLRLPDEVNARLRARTSNSSITTEFNVTTQGTQSKHSLEGLIGSGGPLLDLSTSNGAIRIVR